MRRAATKDTVGFLRKGGREEAGQKELMPVPGTQYKGQKFTTQVYFFNFILRWGLPVWLRLALNSPSLLSLLSSRNHSHESPQWCKEVAFDPWVKFALKGSGERTNG